jgi:hypothetical protein
VLAAADVSAKVAAAMIKIDLISNLPQMGFERK